MPSRPPAFSRHKGLRSQVVEGLVALLKGTLLRGSIPKGPPNPNSHSGPEALKLWGVVNLGFRNSKILGFRVWKLESSCLGFRSSKVS